MKVGMVKEPNPDKENFFNYYLKVFDDDNVLIKKIFVADMDRQTSGMNYVKWKYSTRKRDAGKNVIGAFFYISAMGHELDQWRYFDLDSGEDVTK